MIEHRRSDAGRSIRSDTRRFKRAVEPSELGLTAFPLTPFKNASMLWEASVHAWLEDVVVSLNRGLLYKNREPT